MVEVHRKAPKTEGFPVFPGGMCANCGTNQGVELISSTPTVVRFLLLGGSEWKVPLLLPSCPACRKSFERKRPGLFAVVCIWALIGLVIFPGTVFVPGLLEADGNPGLWIAAGVSALIVALVFGVVLRPRGAQTSYWQPVWIRNLKQRFLSGEVVGATFAFSNERYARAVHAANAGCTRLIEGSPVRLRWPAQG